MKNISIVLSLSALLFSVNIHAQNVGINATGATPNTSAMLDVNASNKGVLIPQVSLTSLTDATTITTPATSLLIYNTNAAITGGVGYYYNSGTSASPVWVLMLASSSTLGQSSTNYYTTAGVTLGTIGTNVYMSGFPVTVNVPANSTVIMTISMGVQTTGVATGNYSIVDVIGYVDGLGLANGCYQRLDITNTAALVTQIRYASFSESFSLSAGSHTFGIVADITAGTSTATAGGNGSSVLEGTLNITIIKN